MGPVVAKGCRGSSTSKGKEAEVRENVDLLVGSLFVAGLSILIASPSFAQGRATSRQTVCSADEAAIVQLSTSLSHMALWDDTTLARARTSLSKLQQSRTNVIRLTRRLIGAEESAANAEAFDRSGEANTWRRDAVEVRAAIDTEKKRAKALAADAGVSCPGCTYSVVIGKVEAVINAAVSARAQAVQAHQQIAKYRADMAAAGCR